MESFVSPPFLHCHLGCLSSLAQRGCCLDVVPYHGITASRSNHVRCSSCRVKRIRLQVEQRLLSIISQPSCGAESLPGASASAAVVPVATKHITTVQVSTYPVSLGACHSFHFLHLYSPLLVLEFFCPSTVSWHGSVFRAQFSLLHPDIATRCE